MSEEKFGVEIKGPEKDKLTHDILYGFHTQFAENQRTREQSFLKVLGFLGAVIFSYAYVYDKLWQNLAEFSFVAIASELILMFGALLITTIAYNFRRDQHINAKIRRFCGIIGENKIFPEGYDPSVSLMSKFRVVNWMPDFLGVFFWIFPIFQVILFFSYATKLKIRCDISNIDGYVTATFATFIIALSITIGVTAYYFNKLRKILGIKEKLRGKKDTSTEQEEIKKVI